MILTPHILAGAAVATQFSNPFVVALGAIMLHHALDFTPHWEYDITPSKKSTYIKIALDIFAAGAIMLFLIWDLPIGRQTALLWGGFFGVFPDGFVALNNFSRKTYFPRYTKIHEFFHFLLIPKGQKPHLLLGISTQFLVVVISLLLVSGNIPYLYTPS